jgi:uncharacterized protein YsxB (DUF464 family)
LIIITISNITYGEKLDFTDAGGVLSVAVKGHAVFDDIAENRGLNTKKGENIICAAVSYAALTLIKSIRIIGGILFDYTIKNGFLQFSINLSELDQDKKNVLKILLESFIIGLLDVKQKYGEFIELHFNYAR